MYIVTRKKIKKIAGANDCDINYLFINERINACKSCVKNYIWKQYENAEILLRGG